MRCWGPEDARHTHSGPRSHLQTPVKHQALLQHVIYISFMDLHNSILQLRKLKEKGLRNLLKVNLLMHMAAGFEPRRTCSSTHAG